MKNLLNEGEIPGILSMNRYWEGVAVRENREPLLWQSELHDLMTRIGAKRILLIVGEYAKMLKENAAAEEKK